MRTATSGAIRAALVVVALLAAACGDNDDDSTPGDDAAPEEATDAAEATDDDAAAATFPGDEWPEDDAANLGFDPDQLEAIADRASEGDTACLLVTRDGQIAGEWYWGDNDQTTTHEAFSVTKSVTSALVGIAQDDGHLDIDDQATEHLGEWAGTPSEEITVRNLLSGDSGLHSPAGFDIVTAEDATAYGIALEQEEPPGTTWANNEPAIQTLEAVLTKATGDDPAAFAEERLFTPIGAQDTAMGRDPSGNTYMFWNLQTTCRDAARFGYLYLQGGNWDGTQVIPEEWVAESTSASQELNAGYGFLWWLNEAGDGDDGPDQLAAGAPDAPDGMYWALGAFGQVIQVDPGSSTVVVRFGGGDAVYDISAIEWTTQVVTDAVTE